MFVRSRGTVCHLLQFKQRRKEWKRRKKFTRSRPPTLTTTFAWRQNFPRWYASQPIAPERPHNFCHCFRILTNDPHRSSSWVSALFSGPARLALRTCRMQAMVQLPMRLLSNLQREEAVRCLQLWILGQDEFISPMERSARYPPARSSISRARSSSAGE
jgi:hypothetical protein